MAGISARQHCLDFAQVHQDYVATTGNRGLTALFTNNFVLQVPFHMCIALIYAQNRLYA